MAVKKIGVIGLGTGSIHANGKAKGVRTIHAALDAGANLIDMAPAEAVAIEICGEALKGRRAEAMLQVHLGADYASGSYGWTTDPKRAIAEFEQRLLTLGTDYVDFGFIHCIDEDADFDKVLENGIWDYALRCRDEGIIRQLAFSTHTPSIARRFLATGEVDLGMSSINPMYDYTDESEYGKGTSQDRADIYREFEAAGVGISVMKVFAGGQLTDAKTSPFGQALASFQCLQYALDKPGVVSVLPGVRDTDDLKDALSFFDAAPEERDHSKVGSFAKPIDRGVCVYCGHWPS